MSVGISQLTLNNMVNVNMKLSVNQEIIKSNFQILDKRLQRLQSFTKISEKQHQQLQKSNKQSIELENWKQKIENNQENIKKIFFQISLNRKNTQDKSEIIKNFDSQIKKINLLINQMISNQQSDDQNILMHQNMNEQYLTILQQKIKNQNKLKNQKEQNINELKQRINEMQQQIKKLNQNYGKLKRIVSEKQEEKQNDLKQSDYDRMIKQIYKQYQKLNSQNIEKINNIHTQILQYVKKDTYQREWHFQKQTNLLNKQELQSIKDQQQKNKEEFMKELLELKQKILTITKMIINKFKQSNETINQLKQQLQSFNHQLILGDLTNPSNQYIKLKKENKWHGQSLLPNFLSMEINQSGYYKDSLVGFRQRIFSLQNDVKILMNQQIAYQLDKKQRDKQLKPKKSTSIKQSISLNQYQSKKQYGIIKLQETKDIVKQLSQNLTKQFQKKLHDFKLAITLTMKTFEKMMENKQTKQNFNLRYTQLQDFINQLKHLISKKADQESFKKSNQNLQNKINQIIFYICNMQSQKDALTARRGWACLSCQKELQDYRGRMGQHLAWDRLPGINSPKLSVLNLRQKTKSLYKNLNKTIYNNTTLPHIKDKK